MEVVTSYKTSDGKVFKTEIEAAGHEKYLEIKPVVEAFIEKAGLQKAQAGLMRKHLPAFVAFQASQEAAE